ncbi:MAG: GAF domain-containing protein [Chloroflexi bacterium]|nr:GAF domain-containing protein [Chloroflexota bacterium]
MPKKPTSKRLDKLFDNMEQESVDPAAKVEKKKPLRPGERKPPLSAAHAVPTRPLPRASAPAQTGALEPAETVAIAQHGGGGSPSSMSLAFQLDHRNWATLQVVDEAAEREWDSNEQQLVKQVTEQLTQALENARLFQETRSRAEELAILNEMGRELTSLFNVESIAEAIYRYASRLMDTTNLFVTLFDEAKQELKPVYVISNRERLEIPARKAQNTLTDHVLRTRKTLFIPDDLTARIKDLGIEMSTYGNNRPALCWLGAPMLAGETAIGAIVLQNTDLANVFTERHRDLLTAIAGQAAIAIQNARLFEETQRHSEELSVLNELNQRLSAQLNVDQVLQEIYDGVTRLIDAKNFYIGLHSPEKNEISFPLNVSESVVDKSIVTIPADKGMTGHVLRTRKPLFAPENVVEVMQKLGIAVVGEPAKCWMGVPLFLGEQVIGVMAAQSYTEPNAYSEHDLELMTAISAQAAIAIQNARLFSETERRAREISALAEITAAASQSLDLKSILNDVLQKVLKTLEFEAGFVTIFNQKRGVLERAARFGLPGEMPADPAEGLEGSLCNYIYKHGQMFATHDLRQNSPVDASDSIAQGFLGYLGIPLTLRGATIGTLCVFRKNVEPIPENSIVLARSIGNQIGFAIENARLFEEMRVSQQALTRSEGDLRALFASMQDVVLVIDRDTRYVRIAPTNPSKLFRPPEELIGQRMDDILPPETSEPFHAVIKQALETGEAAQIEYKLPIGDQEFWFLASVSRLNENEVFWVARDITQRKESEVELQKFKLGIDQSSDAVFMTDINGKITYVNPGFEAVYGYTKEEAVGQNPRIVKSGLLTKENYEQFWDTLLHKHSVTGEIVNKTKDGRLVTIAGTNSPILSENGEILGFLAVHHDITAAKQAEDTLRRRNEYLSATAEISRLVTSTLDMPTLFSRTANLVSQRFGFYHAGIFVTEETGFRAILQAATGEAGAEMLRQKHSLAVGSKSVVGEVTESGHAVIVNDTVNSAVHKFNPLLPETHAEAALPLRVGSRTIGALDIQSIHPNAFSENDIAVLQILADQVAIAIDNARSYELSMQAVKEMREADKLKSQFLANMSHELRTPLNSIIGFSRVIIKGIDGPITDLQQQDLLAIHNSGQHLLGLINDILDLSRIEAGKMELTFDEVNLGDLITSVLSTVTGLIKDKQITLHRDIPSDLPTVRADAMRVRQVLLNLLSNAAKFTDEGAITVHASVKEAATGHPEITVRVTDTGPGISAEDQTKLFQPFSQVDASPTRKSGGSGLGLSISNHLIQMHGGHIGLESEVGQGSTFYFTLPAFRGKSESEHPHGNRVILAIDDDPQIINLYERYLQPQGYQVVALSDPTRAVERVKLLKPMAVTLDIMMPGYDGWRVLADLKSNPETRDVPVIVCSIIEDREKGFSLGAADYLVKPIIEDDLLNSLDRLNSDGRIHDVLVVDDNPDTLRLIEKMMSRHGQYRAITVRGGNEGWTVIQTRPPQAVILDLFMPDMNGFEILEKMRADEKLRDVPVIIVTSGELTVEQARQFQEFGQRMIQKSALNEKQLIQTLERTLQRAQK